MSEARVGCGRREASRDRRLAGAGRRRRHAAGVAALALGVALALALGPTSATRADQDDPRLDALFERLRSAGSLAQARPLELRIWAIWTESGRADVDALMEEGIRDLAARELESARTIFDRVVRLAPGFAEGWNKRATVHYLLDDFAASVEDIRRTLALEPRHFGALAGMGLIFLERGDEEGALAAFESVLEIHPMAPGARIQIERLNDELKGKAL